MLHFKIYPRPPKNLHRLICHICDISQLCIYYIYNTIYNTYNIHTIHLEHLGHRSPGWMGVKSQASRCNNIQLCWGEFKFDFLFKNQVKTTANSDQVKNNNKSVYQIKKSKKNYLSVKMNNKSIYQWNWTTYPYQLKPTDSKFVSL